jgi:hypothetical protein
VEHSKKLFYGPLPARRKNRTHRHFQVHYPGVDSVDLGFIASSSQLAITQLSFGIPASQRDRVCMSSVVSWFTKSMRNSFARGS